MDQQPPTPLLDKNMSEDEEDTHIYDEARNSSSGFDPWIDDDTDRKLPAIQNGNDDTAHLLAVYNHRHRDRKKINNVTGGVLGFFILSVITVVNLTPDKPNNTSRPLGGATQFVLASPPPELEDVCMVDSIRSEVGQQACKDMCREASCCMSTDKVSCFEDNKDICSLYAPCGSLYIGQKETGVLPAPSNIDNLCAFDSLGTEHGFYECQTACLMGECCLTNRWDSCFFSHIEVCNGYASCQNLKERDHINPVKMVEEACKASSLLKTGGRRKCENLCKARECCFSGGKSNCFADNQMWCGEFAACEDLNSISNEDIMDEVIDTRPGPPARNTNNPNSNIDINAECRSDQLYSQSDMDKCETACLPSVCCFSKEPCYPAGTVDCEKYAVCEDLIVSAFDDELMDDYVNPSYNAGSKVGQNNDYAGLSPPANLRSICSEDNVVTDVGRRQCELKCNLGLCCIGIPNDCSDMRVCDAYSPCHSIWHDYETVKSSFGSGLAQKQGAGPSTARGGLTRAPSNLDLICSDERLRTPEGQEECEMKCDYAICCMGIYSDCSQQKERCDSYSPCHVIWGQSQYKDTSSLPDLVGQGASSPKSGLNQLGGSMGDSSIRNHHAADTSYDDNTFSTSMDDGTTMPPAGLEAICTYQNKGDGFDDCMNLCKTASCCFQGGKDSCAGSRSNFCHAWNFCSIVFEEFYELDLQSGIDNGSTSTTSNRDTEGELDIHTSCTPKKLATYQGRAQCDDACEQWECCDDQFKGCSDKYPEQCFYYNLCPSDNIRRTLNVVI